MSASVQADYLMKLFQKLSQENKLMLLSFAAGLKESLPGQQPIHDFPDSSP